MFSLEIRADRVNRGPRQHLLLGEDRLYPDDHPTNETTCDSVKSQTASTSIVERVALPHIESSLKSRESLKSLGASLSSVIDRFDQLVVKMAGMSSQRSDSAPISFAKLDWPLSSVYGPWLEVGGEARCTIFPQE